MKFKAILNEHFPGAIAEAAFVKRSIDVLEPYGFGDHSAIACVAMCRDEVCTPLHNEVQRHWGEAFNMTSLAGVPLCGRTGFAAAHAHSPNRSQRERYVYYCMAHIGVGADGTFGECTRPGRDEVSKACGALVALHAELERGQVALEHDPDDMEQSLLRSRLLRRLGWGACPTLVELTHAARQESLETVERLIPQTADIECSDYAVFNGIQVHHEGQRNVVYTAVSYVVVNGVRHELSLSASEAESSAA